MLENSSSKLKYGQISDYILRLIKNSKTGINSPIPSIHQVAKDFNVANETVVKAYKKLKEKGIIYSLKGKGYYIASTNIQINHSVFVLFDTFTSYKETIYNGILETFNKEAIVELYFHHYNLKVFENIIKENLGKYTEYVILPWEHKKIVPILKIIPQNQLFIIDRPLKNFQHHGVCQDFEMDVYNGLSKTSGSIKKYQKLYFFFRNTITIPPKEMIPGFIRFCCEKNLDYEIIETYKNIQIQKGEAYLVIDDEDLVDIVLKARDKNYQLGNDIGIISYNETSLKKIAAGGISVISTDFRKIGNDIASMILTGKKEILKNPCGFIDRGSF